MWESILPYPVSSSPLSSSTGGVEGLPEDDFKQSDNDSWPKRDLFFSFIISSQQAPSQFLIQSLLLAAQSCQLRHTLRRHLKSVQVAQSTSKPPLTSP